MYQDFKDLLSAFHARGVKYLIVGGYAVSFHGQPRATKDLDIFIKAEPANAELAYMALASFGAFLDNVGPSDFTDPRLFVRFGREPVAIDICLESTVSTSIPQGSIGLKPLSTAKQD